MPGRSASTGGPVHVRSPQHAQALGISTVYQEVNLCPNLSVGENVLIGRAPRRLGLDRLARAAPTSARRDPPRPRHRHRCHASRSATYSVAIQQMAAIARALEVSSTRILILDEPTSSLDTHETEAAVRRDAQAARVGHRDRVHHPLHRPGLRGRGPDHGPAQRAPGRDLPDRRDATLRADHKDARARVDRARGHGQRMRASETARPARARRGSSRPASVGSGSIEPLDLELRAGEVVGVAGLLGSGRTEIADLLFGIERPDSGTLISRRQAGATTSRRCTSIGRGVALCPEDRKAEGIVDRPDRAREHHPRGPGRPGLAAHPQPGGPGPIADEYIRLPQHRHPGRRPAGGQPERRQPAEGHPRPLARDEPAGPDPRRADAGHRHRRQGGGAAARPAHTRPRACRASSSRPSSRRSCAPATGSWCSGPGQGHGVHGRGRRARSITRGGCRQPVGGRR